MRALKAEGGGLAVPREFVFLERATIGLGGAFLRLGARLNFHRMYEDAIADFDESDGRAPPGRGAQGGRAEGKAAWPPIGSRRRPSLIALGLGAVIAIDHRARGKRLRAGG